MGSVDLRSRRRGGPTVQAWAFPHLIAWTEGQCGDASPIRRLPGLDALDGPDARISEATAEAAWRLAETLTRDDAVGVHVAESLPRGALDLVEYAVRSRSSRGAALERLAHYGGVLSDRVAARIDANDHGFSLIVGDVGASALHPARAEFALAMALKLAREVTGFAIVPVQVAFAHDRPNDTSEHRRFFSRTDPFRRRHEHDASQRRRCRADLAGSRRGVGGHRATTAGPSSLDHRRDHVSLVERARQADADGGSRTGDAHGRLSGQHACDEPPDAD